MCTRRHLRCWSRSQKGTAGSSKSRFCIRLASTGCRRHRRHLAKTVPTDTCCRSLHRDLQGHSPIGTLTGGGGEGLLHQAPRPASSIAVLQPAHTLQGVRMPSHRRCWLTSASSVPCACVPRVGRAVSALLSASSIGVFILRAGRADGLEVALGVGASGADAAALCAICAAIPGVAPCTVGRWVGGVGWVGQRNTAAARGNTPAEGPLD